MSSDEAPARRKRSKLLTICPFILGNECCERMAFYGIKLNLVNYFRHIGASSSAAASSVSAFVGASYCFPLLGGWIADSRLGRYKTILVFSVLYVIGMVLLALSTAIPGIRVDNGEHANGAQWTLLAFGLIVVAVGTGGIKPNVSSFGADQFDDNIEQDRREKKSFFNWFYFFINVGALIASTVIVKIQDEGYWDIGFAIPAGAMVFAMFLFVFGSSLYTKLPIYGSPLSRFFAVTRCALANRRREIRATTSSAFDKKRHWLDWAIGEDHYTSEQVDEIKLVYKPWKIFLCFVLGATVAEQLVPLWILQAEQMDRNITFFGKDYTIPSASMVLFNTLTVLIFLPLYDLVILPIFKRCFNYTPTYLQKIGTGIFLHLLLVIYSMVLEWRRLRLYHEGRYHIGVDDNGTEVEVVELSIWWQSFCNSFAAIPECLISVAILEFFYSQAPETMKSIMTSISLLAVSIGGFLSSFMLFLVDKISSALGSQWITNNLNEGHMDYYYLLLLVIEICVFIWFIFVSKKYEYKTEGKVLDFETIPMLDSSNFKSYSLQQQLDEDQDQNTQQASGIEIQPN